jgi:hypothetical protein
MNIPLLRSNLHRLKVQMYGRQSNLINRTTKSGPVSEICIAKEGPNSAFTLAVRRPKQTSKPLGAIVRGPSKETGLFEIFVNKRKSYCAKGDLLCRLSFIVNRTPVPRGVATTPSVIPAAFIYDNAAVSCMCICGRVHTRGTQCVMWLYEETVAVCIKLYLLTLCNWSKFPIGIWLCTHK